MKALLVISIMLCAVQLGTGSECGGNLTQHYGEIKSPNYPNKYPKNIECTWTITTFQNTRIVVVFSYFNTRQRPNCTEDYIEVIDGLAESHSQDARLCGDQIPAIFLSTGNIVTIRFVSGTIYKRTSYKFLLNWKVSDTFVFHPEQLSWKAAADQCRQTGGVLPTSSNITMMQLKTIMSTNNVTDMWMGKYFTPWAWLKGCFKTNSTFINSLNNTEFKTNQMKECLMHCRKFNYFGLQGTKCFCLDNSEGLLVATKKNCEYTCPGNEEERCGGSESLTLFMNDICYTNSSEWNGTISKPGHGFGYTCQAWAADGPHKNDYISDSLYPEGSVQNASNYCRDPEGDGITWCYTTDTDVNSRYCYIPKCLNETESLDGRMYSCMEFKWNQGKTISRQAPCEKENIVLCKQIEDKTMIWISTKNKLSWNEGREICIKYSWSIYDKSPENKDFYWNGYSRNFTYAASTEHGQNPIDCFKVQLQNGQHELGVKCVEKHLYVCQHAAVVCGEAVHANNGTITSPDYPNGYDKLLHCVWTITVDTGQYVVMVINMEIEDTYACNHDYIKVYEGNGSLEKDLIVKPACGKRNISVQSVKETVTVIFISDDTTNGSGFDIKWEAAPIPTISTEATTVGNVSTTGGGQMNKTVYIRDGHDSQTLSGGEYGAIIVGVLVAVTVAVVAMVILCKRRKSQTYKKEEKVSGNTAYQLTELNGQPQQESDSHPPAEYGDNSNSTGNQNMGFNAESMGASAVNVNDETYSFAEVGDNIYSCSQQQESSTSIRKQGVKHHSGSNNDDTRTGGHEMEVYNSLNETFEENIYINKPEDNLYNHLTLSDNTYNLTGAVASQIGVTKPSKPDMYAHLTSGETATNIEEEYSTVNPANTKISYSHNVADSTYSHLQT